MPEEAEIKINIGDSGCRHYRYREIKTNFSAAGKLMKQGIYILPVYLQ